TGSVVVETIFGIPGVGRYFVQAALNRDYTLVMGTVIVIAIFIIVFNLIVDVLYALIYPRVRYGCASWQAPTFPTSRDTFVAVRSGTMPWRGRFATVPRSEALCSWSSWRWPA